MAHIEHTHRIRIDREDGSRVTIFIVPETGNFQINQNIEFSIEQMRSITDFMKCVSTLKRTLDISEIRVLKI